MIINNSGHMTKMAATPIYGKNPSKFFFSRTTRLISTKLGMKHLGLKCYNVFINHDLWMTLTYFTARSTYVAHAFEWGKLLKCHLKGKTCKEWTNELKIFDSEKHWTPGLVCPHPEAIYIYMGNIHVYYNNIQRSSRKPLGQSKPNIIGSIMGIGNQCVYE